MILLLRLPLRMGMRLKISLAFFLISTAVSIGLAIASYAILQNKLIRELQGRALNISGIGSLAVDRAALGRLHKIASQSHDLSPARVREIELSADYRLISEQLNRIRDREKRLLRFVYIVMPGANEAEAVYLVDADVLEAIESPENENETAAEKNADADADADEDEASEDDVSHFASPLDVTEFPVMQRALREKKEFVERDFFYDEEFDVNSFSAYAPILAADGSLLGLLCVDMVDTDVRAALSDVSRLSFWAVFGALALALITSIVLGTFFTRGILELEAVVQRFGRRDFQARAVVRSGDEVGRLGVSFNSMAQTIEDHSQELQNLLTAYSRFVPQDFLRLLEKKSILDVRLGDQVQREMTVLFSDIRSFTTLSESMTPRESFEFINSYLKLVGPEVREHGGVIDKYIGDAVMALYPRSPDDAVNSALAILGAVREFNRTNSVTKLEDILRIGIGIHTGVLMLGTVGEAERMDSTVIADAVNLASRIEGLTRSYGASLIVSEATMMALSDRERMTYRFLDRVQVKGKQEAVAIYEICDGDDPEALAAKRRTRKAYTTAVRHYRAGEFARALEILQSIDEEYLDVAIELYIARCERLLADGVPANWKGVVVLENK